MKKTVPLLVSITAGLVLASFVALGVPNEQARAAFPGINGKIVFERGGPNSGIYTISFSGNNLTRIASDSYSQAKDSSVYNESPSWSPNGQKIVFARNNNYTQLGARRRTDIYIMNADGSNKRVVTNERLIPGETKEDGQPSFSPSGRKIIFWRAKDLYTINLDGTNLTRITNDGRKTWEGSPVWSPDGSKIAYDVDSGIVVMNSDGSSPTEVASDVWVPDWSPDGTQITYTDCDRFGVMNADGSEQTILSRSTRFHSTCNLLIQNSAFSPGGGKIVFSADRDGDFDLYIIDTDGSGLRQLTNLPGYDGGPDWQPIQ